MLEQELKFPVFVELIADALVQHRGSGRQAFQRALDHDTLRTSIEAAYGKLRRVPLSLSERYLEDSTARLRELRLSSDPVIDWPARFPPTPTVKPTTGS